MKKLAFACLCLFIAAVSGCAGKTNFPPIDGASRIEIIANSNERLKTITNPQEIIVILAFINARCEGWGGIRDAAGVPIPVVTLDFYAEEKFRGHFGIGSGFFETQRVGDSASRGASSKEQKKLASLLHIPETAYVRK